MLEELSRHWPRDVGEQADGVGRVGDAHATFCLACHTVGGYEIRSHHEMNPLLDFVGIYRGIDSFQGFLVGAKWISSTHSIPEVSGNADLTLRLNDVLKKLGAQGAAAGSRGLRELGLGCSHLGTLRCEACWVRFIPRRDTCQC